MPVISLNKEELFKSLGKTYTETEFDELCFEFGIELDDVVEEEGKIIYKIDLPANRYDLLCLEGLSRALLIFQNKMVSPVYKTVSPSVEISSTTQVTVQPSTSLIRPFIVCAILRNINFTQSSYNSFINLQEHLHRNICRKRSLVAIGTHDLNSIKGPFTYKAIEPSKIKFQHLYSNKVMNSKEILNWFRTEPEGKHIKEYTDLIYNSKVYPVIYDSNNDVISLPPIINSSKSKITLNTKDIFIECTATDFTKANIVLNTVCAMFSQYCSIQYQIEKVKVIYESPPRQITDYSKDTTERESDYYPDVSVRESSVTLKEINEIIGVELRAEEVIKLCGKMQLGPARVNNGVITVTVPITRSDILHSCDIVEDIAIAYGYNNIKKTVPVSYSSGKELYINKLSDIIRYDLSRYGYTELMSFALCSYHENYKFLNRKDKNKAVILANPKTIEFQVVRTSLIPGTLKTLSENKSLPYSEGIKLFEVSDIVLCNDKDITMTEEEKDIGCKNERHIVCLYAGVKAGVEYIHGTVDRIFQALGVIPSKEYAIDAFNNRYSQNLLKNEAHLGFYKLVAQEEEEEEGMFFNGMAADIMVKRRDETEFVKIGELGALHPTVLQNFKINIPCSVLEINLQHFA